MKRVLACLLCCVMAVSLLSGCGNNAEAADAEGTPLPELPPPAPEATYTAYDLSRVFEGDRTTATALVDHIVQVTGVVSFISGGITLDRETQYGYIVCNMAEGSKDYSDVLRGDTVTIVGTMTAEYSHIYMEDCHYIGKQAPPLDLLQTPTPAPTDGGAAGLQYGGWELIDSTPTGTTCVLRYRIQPGWDNEATVLQNYYIVQNFINDEGGSEYKEIQYIGLMDLGDGTDQRVISFKLDEALIADVLSGAKTAPGYGAYVIDLWIHDSLRPDLTPQQPADAAPILISPTPSPRPALTITSNEDVIAFLKSELAGLMAQGEVLEDIVFTGRTLAIEADFSATAAESMQERARARAIAMMDTILLYPELDTYWDSIRVAFGAPGIYQADKTMITESNGERHMQLPA